MSVDPNSFEDPLKLRNLLVNAHRLGRDDVVLQCQLRLAELAGRGYDDEIEREFWIAVSAAEEFKTAENGRTTRLTRTRQKHKRVGAMRCITDWAQNAQVTDGFRILLDAGRPDLTGEAIAVRHSDKFDASAVTAAKDKLEKHGVDLSALGPISDGQG